MYLPILYKALFTQVLHSAKCNYRAIGKIGKNVNIGLYSHRLLIIKPSINSDGHGNFNADIYLF